MEVSAHEENSNHMSCSFLGMMNLSINQSFQERQGTLKLPTAPIAFRALDREIDPKSFIDEEKLSLALFENEDPLEFIIILAQVEQNTLSSLNLHASTSREQPKDSNTVKRVKGPCVSYTEDHL